MKKTILALVVALVMCFSMTACGGGGGEVTSTTYMNIDAICIDDSYVNEDDSNKKLVYLFYTLSTEDQNLEICSTSTDLTVDGTNTYESERIIGACDLMASYYFSDYYEEVSVGGSLKVAETFLIPSGDLEAGKTITLSNEIPETDKIKVMTDSVAHYDSAEAMAQAVDAEGYEKAVTARKDADSSTVSAVKEQINGYYWTFYVNSTTYEVEFYAPDEFELRTSLGISNGGTYTVQNGYIFLFYPGDKEPAVEIPYELTSGEIELDLTSAFDVNE